MKTYSKLQVIARVGAGLVLLSAALTAWGINITLNDGSNSVTCATSGNATIGANGDITANVTAGASCDLSGGGAPPPPPPPGSFTLSVNKAGTGSGTVTGTGFNCGADCTESYTENTAINVTLTAAASAGSTFSGWSGAGCSGTGTCTVNQTITSNLNVTATFTADAPPPGSCGPVPENVSVVDTGSISGSWPQQTFFPLPHTVTAFKVTVPAGFTGKGNFTATKTSSAQKSKLVVVSTCPGVLEPVGGQSSCVVYSLESSMVRMTGNAGASSYYCKLTPGNTYYVNAVSKTKVNDTAYTCSNGTNCSFFGSRSSPY